MQNQQQGIINPKYCAPHNVDLAIVRKVLTLTDTFSVTDVNSKMIFNLSASLLTLHNHRVLVDAAGQPVVTLRRKGATGECEFRNQFGAIVKGLFLLLEDDVGHCSFQTYEVMIIIAIH
ncbi:Protein LURP-one-related 15 [Vigna angularis]|uniref:Protein LURP-one-related 15 n=1 Tax=Phaseolus angularis TaxID=3914 RepID=A0A8T0JTS7_PHAAN|nr:Protein LURP-one-related 15 [Vigna angularis]